MMQLLKSYIKTRVGSTHRMMKTCKRSFSKSRLYPDLKKSNVASFANDEQCQIDSFHFVF
jgi:hypothetical protein